MLCFRWTYILCGVSRFLPMLGGRSTLGQVADQSATTEQVADRQRMWTTADELFSQGELDRALDQFHKILNVDREWFGDQDDRTIETWRRLGELELYRGNWDAARAARKEVLRICATRFGEDHWQTREARIRVDDMELLRDLTPEERNLLRELTVKDRQMLTLYEKGR